MAVVTITKENFENEVLKSDKPVLLDFWATWCGPCRMVSPIVDEIANERDDIKVGKINVDAVSYTHLMRGEVRAEALVDCIRVRMPE